MNFKTQFDNLKKLNLPTSDFVVVGSGPMSVRGIRESEDIDVIVTPSLWNEMSKKYKVGINSFGVEILNLENDIETLNPVQSLFGNSKTIPVEEIFTQADTFDGIKFLNLDHLKKIKRELGREKDLRDIELIDKYLYEQEIIKSLEAEGYDNVWVYQAEPNEVDDEHTHSFDTKLKILEGSIRIKILSRDMIQDFSLKKDGEIEIMRNQPHSAVVGQESCRYIVAERK